MTGEITLRGAVLPVGGIKEKVLAARRAGIREIYLPDRNRKDVEEIDAALTERLEFRYVERASDLLDTVMAERPKTVVRSGAAKRAGLPPAA